MRIGVDLGGTKIEIVALDDEGAVRHRARVATPAHSYDAIVDSVRELVVGAERALGVSASVGVGTPGSLSPQSGLMRNSNTLCLNGRMLDRDLSRALGREVRIANDANCFALSEAIDGAGAGASVVFGVILGTGCGGGVVVHSRPIAGATSVAGEWGHNPLPWPEADEQPGPACYCGKLGCIETFVSGPAISREHAARGGRALSVEAIAERAAAGEPLAQASIARLHGRLARALGSVVNVLDPDVIVLGGGVSRLQGLADAISRALPAYVFGDCVRTRVVPALHGDASGVRGAAWLFPRS